ncbi:MAG: hypothetical protein ACI9WU_001431 [Myxococcota bacterium]|jgi:hypothetical protein
MNVRNDPLKLAASAEPLPDFWEGAAIHAHLTPPHGATIPDEEFLSALERKAARHGAQRTRRV